MNPLTLTALVLAAVGAVAAVWLVVRGMRASRSWHAAIAEHVAVTGDFPSVADWRAGRIGAAALADTVEFDPITDPDGSGDGPVVVTVTVVEDSGRALPGGPR